MKKGFLIAVVMALAITPGVTGCIGPPEATVIELDYVTFWTSSDLWMELGDDIWMDKIAGRVVQETSEYEIKWNKVGPVPPTEVLNGIMAGTYDVGTTYPSVNWTLFPMTEAFELPVFMNENALVASMAFREAWGNSTVLQDEYASQNLEVMHLWACGPGHFMFIGGRNVTTMGDLEGLEIGVRAPRVAEAIELLGAEPVSLSWPEVLERLQAGLLDGIFDTTDVMKVHGLGAHIRWITLTPFIYNMELMKVMNQDTWDGLPAEVKVIFNEVNAEWTEYYGKLGTWVTADGLRYAEGLGIYVYDLPNEDPAGYQQWMDACASIADDWVGDDPDRQAMLDHALYHNAQASAQYGAWMPGEDPPPPPDC
jgi:TRAP-type transport system periplasmic protein